MSGRRHLVAVLAASLALVALLLVAGGAGSRPLAVGGTGTEVGPFARHEQHVAVHPPTVSAEFRRVRPGNLPVLLFVLAGGTAVAALLGWLIDRRLVAGTLIGQPGTYRPRGPPALT